MALIKKENDVAFLYKVLDWEYVYVLAKQLFIQCFKVLVLHKVVSRKKVCTKEAIYGLRAVYPAWLS